ncbi:MAG TPA: hypothetical protein VNN22_22135 [Verrucomicrobiae bacterium]|nr:hypothetical protein [Verrucomicrobiae bacterium]
MKTPIILFGILCVCLLAGCDKPASRSATSSTDGASDSNATSSTLEASKADGPKEHEKICFACKGAATIKCLAPGCVNGQVDCPGTCLRLSRGTWIHMDVPGHSPTDLWQKFNQGDGSYTAYTQAHVGHIIAMQNGKAVDIGPCPVCGGAGKVSCPVCKGTGQQACLICGGKKYIPDAWTPTDNPWLNRQPDLIRLTDRRIMLGKIVSTVGTNMTIKTRDGKWLHLNSAELMPKTGTISTNAAAP